MLICHLLTALDEVAKNGQEPARQNATLIATEIRQLGEVGSMWGVLDAKRFGCALIAGENIARAYQDQQKILNERGVFA